MENFQKYLAAFDGSTEWSTVQPLFDAAFHDECVVITADGEMTKQHWAAMARGLCEKGSVVSGFKITKREGESFYYKLTITPGGGPPLHLTAKATLRDGRIVLVEPLDPELYSEMIQRSS